MLRRDLLRQIWKERGNWYEDGGAKKLLERKNLDLGGKDGVLEYRRIREEGEDELWR